MVSTIYIYIYIYTQLVRVRCHEIMHLGLPGHGHLGKLIMHFGSGRPVLDEVHFLRLCCNPASPSEKHVTESRACKTLFRKQVFPRFEIPFGSI